MAHSVFTATLTLHSKEIFIIGGQKIYELFFELFENTKYFELQLNKIYLTYLDKDYKCDTFFKKLTEDFKLKNYSDKYYNKDEDVYFRYCIYEKDIVPKENCENKYLAISRNILNNGNYTINVVVFDKKYSEKEVNIILDKYHKFNDIPLLRRELISKKYLRRKRDGSIYWRE